MPTYRSILVWACGVLFILGAFLGFVATGWPGGKDTCIPDDPAEANTCFCEAFDRADVEANRPGVRQPVNTWFNLYAIITSLLVAIVLVLDRLAIGPTGIGPNVMKSNNPIADLYVFAVQFLGLGSMWFHASLTRWGGVFDGMSMYLYASFLVFYTVRRIWNSEAFFWWGYFGTVILFSFVLHLLIPSYINIGILVLAYLVLEAVVWGRTKQVMQGKARTVGLWVAAAASIIAATVFWALSQTGKTLCDPNSGFQAHGMLWHPLAGLMAVLLYFYWREADDPS